MYGQVVAGILYAIENVAMLKSISDGVATNPFPLIAALFAALKFLLIISGLVYVWIGILAWFSYKFLPEEQSRST